MSQPVSKKKYYTLEEYYALEEKAEFKSEYFDGEIYPLGDYLQMAGGKPNHNIISMNIGTALNVELRRIGRRCPVYSSDQRTKILENGFVAYPDATVVYPPVEYAPERQDTIINPQVLFEVLSPSTANYDRGLKSIRYRAAESLQMYLLIEQSFAHVERFQRAENGEWLFKSYDNLADIIEFPVLGVAFAVEELYINTTLKSVEVATNE